MTAPLSVIKASAIAAGWDWRQYLRRYELPSRLMGRTRYQHGMRGNGNRAARREEQLALAAMPPAPRLTTEDVEAMAELDAERRLFVSTAPTNFHD